jgi:hypothetical protein
MAQIAAAGLTFEGMTDLGIRFGFDLNYAVLDKSLGVFLCVGADDNQVKVTGTTPRTRQADVLAAIDRNAKWGELVDIWLVGKKNGASVVTSPKVKFMTHVKPFFGTLTISGIANDNPRMTYPGNGKGRLLSPKINGRHYFIYAGKLETDNAMRGFDCTSFPMALLSIRSIAAPGYGKQVCEAAGATQCNLEQIRGKDLELRFQKDTVPLGIYILFSAGHVLLYNSDKNWLYEFNIGGFRSTRANQRHLHAPQNLWWMRKLPERFRPLFN